MSKTLKTDFKTWLELVSYAKDVGFVKQLWTLTKDILKNGKPTTAIVFENDEQAKLFFDWVKQIKVDGKLQFAPNAVDKVVPKR